jgi:SAM-dependent methyltransferase
MTFYERIHSILRPVLPYLYARTNSDLRNLIKKSGRHPFRLLDVGSRSSGYTIGLPASVTMLDIPRESDVQSQLNLGFSDEVMQALKRKRSNIEGIILQDMTKSTLPNESFDGASCVEVIEHVPGDDLFISQIARVLKKGGFLYLTTPNGDYIKNEPPNYNPDHIRHYKRDELHSLLAKYFSDVKVVYGFKTGVNRHRGFFSLSARRPLRMLRTFIANYKSHRESRGLDETARRTANLFAICIK